MVCGAITGVCACCACAGTCCNLCCKSSQGNGSSFTARLGSLGLFLFGTILSFVMLEVSHHFHNWPWGSDLGMCGQYVTAVDKWTCISKLNALRVCFAMAAYFVIQTLLAIPAAFSKQAFFVKLQTQFWFLKCCLFILLLIGFYFIPNNVVPWYATFSQFLGAIFLVIQVILLLDFLYRWNAIWVQREWKAPLIIVSIGLYAGWLALCIISYVFFHCPAALVFTSLTIVGPVVLTLLALKIEHGALLHAAAIAAYSAFLCLSSIMSLPRSAQCGPCPPEGSWQRVLISIGGLCVSVLSLAWSSFRTASNVAQSSDANEHQYQRVRQAEEGESEPSSEGDAPPNTESLEPETARYPYVKFHLVMLLATSYVAMLMIGWTLGSAETTKLTIGSGVVSSWVKIASQWATMLLYVWTLVAPLVFPNRDWGLDD